MSETRAMTNARLANLWLAAMEGNSIGREDVLDVIDEVCRLRELANLPPPPIPTPATVTTDIRISLPSSI